MKVLLTSPNTTALPAVQRASTGTGSLQEGCCCDEAEILLKSTHALPRRKSRLWALRVFSATSIEFPGLWFFSPSVQTWKTSSIMIQECLRPCTWHRCLPYSVMLPLSFLIPTLPYTAWLSLKSSVTHCSLENMEQEGSSADATVLRQILPGSIHILLSVCSLDCPSRNICKTGN